MLIVFVLLLQPAQENCGLCHPRTKVEHRESIHFHDGIGCTACHGGDAGAIAVEAAHRGGFGGVPSRAQIPRLCASCHSDPERMRPYNLPTDQWSLYQTSGHGRALANGDSRVAVCTDCHTAHRILRRTDPESPVFFRNIPDTCGKCHADSALMQNYGIDADVTRQYHNSVHARELLENGNPNAPECSRCHGIHGAAPPGLGDVSRVCGGCHEAVLDAFSASPHARSMQETGLPACVACHDNHATQEIGTAQIADTCLGCHVESSSPVEDARKMEILFARAEDELEKARLLIQQAEQIPLYVEDYLARLEEAHTHLVEAEPALHTASVEEVERFTRPARAIGEEIQSEIHAELSDLNLRKIGLPIFWFYLLLTIVIVTRARRERFTAVLHQYDVKKGL